MSNYNKKLRVSYKIFGLTPKKFSGKNFPDSWKPDGFRGGKKGRKLSGETTNVLPSS